MADWIHCNKCSHKFHPNIKFYVRECSHVECQSCSKQNGETEGRCATCGKGCRRILICASMKPDMLLYFKSFAQYLDKAKEVYEYQQRQQTNLCKQLSAKYLHAKREVLKAYKLIDDLKRDISTLQSGGKLDENGRTYATSTPILKDSPSMLNASLSTVANVPNSSVTCSSPGIYSLKELLPRPGHARRMNGGRSADVSVAQSFSPMTTSSSIHVVPGSRNSMAQLHSYYKRSLGPMNMGRYNGPSRQ